MAVPVKASMPADLDLVGQYTVRFTALDPSTGNVVAGVQVKNMVLAVEPGGTTTPGDLAVGPFLLVPGSGA